VSTTNSLTHAMCVIKTGHGKKAVNMPRVSPDSWVHSLGQLLSAPLMHSRGLKRQGMYTRMCEDTSVFQGLHGGGPHHTSQINASVRTMMAEDDAEEAAGCGGQGRAVLASCRGACRKCAGGGVWWGPLIVFLLKGESLGAEYGWGGVRLFLFSVPNDFLPYC